MTVSKPREIAARLLLRLADGHDYAEFLLDDALASPGLAAVDRGLLQELVCGVTRWRATLDWLIARRTEGRTQKAVLQTLLRLGLYQIFWLDRIPPHAAVHETVELGKQLGCGPQAGFLNAVLRGCLREFQATRQLLAELKQTDPALGFSHPAWLVQRWQQRWTAEEVAFLLNWNNTPPLTYSRVNSLALRSPDALREQWTAERVEAAFWTGPADWLADTFVFELRSHPPLTQLGSFQQGRFYLQDPSTLLAVHLLNPQPGEAVLDVCAAPGGKTTYLAQCMGNRGRIVAEDPSGDRLGMVTENCRRLGVTIVETRVTTSGAAVSPEQFDRVLVDVPCSNTGVMRRRVDLRWRIRPEEISRLRASQLEILDRAAVCVKPGGLLAYSTCSLEPEENGEVVEAFLSRQPVFHRQQERTLLPFRDRVDGAYVTTLRRSATISSAPA